MATDKVPGADPRNADKLARGCWAEHSDPKDNSLIYVKDIDENSRVIFEVYDLANPADPVYYPYAMAQPEFEEHFSFDPKSKGKDRWTWHDKTPFPWERVMAVITRPEPVRNVEQTLSAAQRLARSLDGRMHHLDERHVEDVSGVSTRARNAAAQFWQGFKNLMDEVFDR